MCVSWPEPMAVDLVELLEKVLDTPLALEKA